MSWAALLAQARLSGDWAPVVASIPYFQFLGVQWHQSGTCRRLTMSAKDHLVGDPALPALHGGTLGAILESAAHFECLAATAGATLPRTITLTVDYLRSAKLRDTHASAVVVKSGRRITTLQARCWQTDEAAPVALATVHLKVD